MVNERVARELRAALETMKGERDQLDKNITAMETLLGQLGAPVKRGPGRPKGSGVKRGPGRPPKAAAAPAAAAPAAPAAPARRGPGRPKGSKNKAPAEKAAPATKRRAPKWSAEAREAARTRMQAYWAERKKKGA